MTTPTRIRLRSEQLEQKLCLASVGWDGAGQGSAELTYYIANAPAQLDMATVEEVIEEALNVWASVADISITQTDVPRQRDSIDISFQPVDGPNGTLAQAHLPDDVNRARIAGDVVFDSAEVWEVGNGLGRVAFDLLLVAVHELGHAIGLEHSNAPSSVMADSVSPQQVFTALASTDVDDVLALYAPASVDLIDQSDLQGDLNGDGLIGQEDIDLVLLNWGLDESLLPEIWVSGRPDERVGQEELDLVLLNWRSESSGEAESFEPLKADVGDVDGLSNTRISLRRIRSWHRSFRFGSHM